MAAEVQRTTSAETCCPIVELRRYTLHSGQRDTLIELFDREFIETQEALDMKVIGQFRLPDDPDHFLWLRGFTDMPSRAKGLGAFYGGPVWKEHRAVANTTMIDSDNVLLLRPARPASGFVHSPNERDVTIASRRFVVSIYSFREPDEQGFVPYFEDTIAPAATERGWSISGYFVTEHTPNNFPTLPVRENENAFVWFAALPETSTLDSGARSLDWQTAHDAFAERLNAPPEILRLEPTARSLLR